MFEIQMKEDWRYYYYAIRQSGRRINNTTLEQRQLPTSNKTEHLYVKKR